MIGARLRTGGADWPGATSDAAESAVDWVVTATCTW